MIFFSNGPLYEALLMLKWYNEHEKNKKDTDVS